MKQENISTENRLLAALAHGSVVTQGLGILVGVVVYITQREKSRYAAFQGLQAAVYQLVNLIIVIGMWVVWGFFYGLSILSLIKLEETNPDAAPPAIFWIAMISMFIPLIYMVLVGLYGLWGALRTWQGKDFKYLIIGSWLEKSGLWKE
ncbi:unnamed protein product [marine sediment metagenome]|uniref:DUF4870 domain-containing protein n=1 Tax=marine sediment metagenome TaxID=412755 RepID=X1CQV3_9ZZZZ